jgi:hypothetical protein
MTSGIDMSLSSTVHKEMCTPRENVGATLVRISVSNPRANVGPLLKLVSSDYEWYSCLNRYDKIFS